MEIEIKQLGCALRLTEDEGSSLRLSEDLWDEATVDFHIFLVWCLLVNRDVNFEGLARSLKGGRVVRRLEWEQSGSLRPRPAGATRGQDIFGSFQQGLWREAGARSESSILGAEGQQDGGAGRGKQGVQPAGVSSNDSMTSAIPETGREGLPQGTACGSPVGFQQGSDKWFRGSLERVLLEEVEGRQIEGGKAVGMRTQAPPEDSLLVTIPTQVFGSTYGLFSPREGPPGERSSAFRDQEGSWDDAY
ncbi:hypothetical protein Salat_2763700 [Sesamum alatum]|uniref:Uncharacterized protein n=1 Tax=Sesamum alatum TaxID=300844 RepID=A0AAE2C946_9LAMI|nr:hypothetical protein Salat_2763700 [Sesamum alatum]